MLFDRALGRVDFNGTTTNGGHLGMTSRPLRRVGRIGSGACGVDVLLWAEGSESRAVERGPCCSKDIGVGKGRCHREFDPADADANLGANFEQLQADGAACGVGEASRGQGDAAQRVDKNIGHGGQPKPQLVGAHGAGGGSVGEQIELTFLDAIFHLAAGTIELLVERAGLMLVGLQRGDDEARIGPALQTTRRCRLQLLRVLYWKSLKRRAGLPLWRFSSAASASSATISVISLLFLARPNR